MAWHPGRRQWTIIWLATLMLVFAWPPAGDRSLGVKVLNWLVDPGGSLPNLPPPLPMGLDDDGDAVAAHDAQEIEYYRARDKSAMNRWRMTLKTARDPIDPATERQILIGIAAVSALLIWRLSARPSA
ncbi:MAG TPA: hypothetical protein VEU08_23895 [Vicinamibacterales bacterium]|nr:hypothetical protein [Vicinamibacterales bacterium]